MAESRSRIRKLKGALLMIGILVFGSVVAFFARHQQKASSDQSGVDAVINQKATISLEGVRHTAVEGGVREWSLDADAADYRIEDKEAVFRTLLVTFHREEGNDVFLSAPLGTWHTDSNDLDVTGHVMIKTRQYELQSEKLTYIDNRRMCITHAPVTITSEAFKITADNMRYDLGRNIIHLDNAIGIIDEDIGL